MVNEEAAKQQTQVDVLLEVNISGDENKTGMNVDALRAILAKTDYQHVQICGLMAMAGLGTDQTQALSQFNRVTTLRDRLQDDCGVALPSLSMGMSADFEQAIAAGATLVRIGSVLFEGCQFPSP